MLVGNRQIAAALIDYPFVLGTATFQGTYPMNTKHCLAGLICLPMFTIAAFAGENGDLWTGPYAGASIGFTLVA